MFACKIDEEKKEFQITPSQKKDDNKISLSNNGYGPITKKLRETLLSIQLEEIADPFDWIYPVTD